MDTLIGLLAWWALCALMAFVCSIAFKLFFWVVDKVLELFDKN